MTRTIGDDSPQSRMLIARNAAEIVLYGLREIPVVFDRMGVAATIQQAIFCIYRALDAGPDSMVQPEALTRAASLLGAAREGLVRTCKKRTFQIDRAAEILADARLHAQAASEAVAFSQLDRRMELPWGEAEASVHAEPFRASFGRPGLHAPRRDAVEPHIDLGEAEPEPEPEVKVQLVKTPESLDELKAMARDLFAAMKEPPADDEPPAAEEEPAPALPVGTAELERQMVAEIARDAIEDIASLGSLRHPIETESWLDQAPFEQRLLNRLDHFASLGVEGLSAAVLYNAESEVPDADRAFGLAFALGCVDGFDTIDAVVTTIRQSAPETFPGFIEGLVLATNPNVDGAMRMLLGMNDPKLVALAVDVLAQRHALNAEDLEWANGSKDPRVEQLVARAMGTNLPQDQAYERLEQLYVRAESGSELHLTAIESGVRRCHPVARQELRRLLERPAPGPSNARAAALLGLCGNARDFELVMGAAQVENHPLALEGLGRLGHVGSIPYLLYLIDQQNEEVAPVAAKELERITGSGLYDVVEEPWVKDLPPEAADMDVPIPMKKVRRISTSPERWRAWERANGQRFEPLKKYRSGVPFSPPQLLAELEALEPRADERERSALELGAATGQDFGFRSSDWVLGQQQSFARMREYFERHSFEPGTWCFAGAGIAARPERKPDLSQAAKSPSVAAQLPWQFDVVTAAEAKAAEPAPVESVRPIEGQDEIPAFLRVAKPQAPPAAVAASTPAAAPSSPEIAQPIAPSVPIVPQVAPMPVMAAAPAPIAPPPVVPSVPIVAAPSQPVPPPIAPSVPIVAAPVAAPSNAPAVGPENRPFWGRLPSELPLAPAAAPSPPVPQGPAFVQPPPVVASPVPPVVAVPQAPPLVQPPPPVVSPIPPAQAAPIPAYSGPGVLPPPLAQPQLQPPPQVVPERKPRPIAPATFFDANVKDLAPGLKPLKKLPWEK